MKHLVYIFLITGFAITLSSCQYKHDQDYYIHNELDTAILVHFDLKGVKTDSEIVIPAQTNKLIYTFGYPFNSTEIIDERQDDAISNIQIETIDSVIKLDESYWVWKQESEYHGVSTIKVDTSIVH